MSASFRRVTGVLLDIDGTLLDSNDAHAQSWVEIFHRYGASARAGVPTLALRCGGWWDDAALAGAVAIYDDPAALLADIDRSPLARSMMG